MSSIGLGWKKEQENEGLLKKACGVICCAFPQAFTSCFVEMSKVR